MSIFILKKAYGFKSLDYLQKLGGFSAKNYLALADNKPVIIKYCSDESKVKKAISIANLLLRQDIPVPNFLKSLKGNQYIKIKDQFTYLYPKIDGDEFGQEQFNTTSFKSIAKALAKIHSTQCTLPEKPKTAEDIEELRTLIRNSSKGSSIDKVVLNLIQTKQQISDKLANKHIKEYPKCLIHGDFHNQNLLFNTNHKLIGILDFEEADIGYKGEDIMHFILLALCYNSFSDQNMQKVQMFISQCLNFITADEFAAGFYAYLKKLSSNFYFEKRLYTNNDLELLPLIKRDARNLRYLNDINLRLDKIQYSL